MKTIRPGTFETNSSSCHTITLKATKKQIDEFNEGKRWYFYNRNLGWNDPKRENVGRIIQDIEHNGHYYKTGDLVIIDFAYVGEITPEEVLAEIAWTSYNSKTYEYEMRYIREKEKTR